MRSTKAGALHNAILIEVNRDGILLSDKRLDREEFVTRLVDASNKVFTREGVAIDVSKEDIHNTLECFEYWRNASVYDIFKPIAERKTEDIYNLLDYMVYDSLYSKNDIDQLKYAISRIEAAAINPPDSAELEQVIHTCIKNCESEKVKASLSILKSSYNFWTQIRDKSKKIPRVDCTSGINDNGIPLKNKWDDINVLLVDAIGALLCWYAGPLSIICAVVASAIYIIATSKGK